MKESTQMAAGTFAALVTIVGIVAVSMWGCPTYQVWQQGMKGSAELKRAEQNRQITIEEAEAENVAAESRAEAAIKIAIAEATAEVERAKGVAEANVIIAEGLKDNEAYLRYLWIQGLKGDSVKVIYVPTEAGLPILEAGKR